MSSMDPFTSLRSVYRLFLRTSSASVLHKPGATKNLRKLYRPYFRGISKIMSQLSTSGKSDAQLEAWVKEWHIRMDNTLSLHYASTHSRGLPHSVLSNLALLLNDEQHRLNRTSYSYLRWQAQLPETSKEYMPFRPKQKKLSDSANLVNMMEKAEGAIGQAVQMAEGFGRVGLGRVEGLRKKPRPRQE